MLKKIEDQEIMTVRQACERYRNHYIGMKITKQYLLSLTDDDEGIAMYTVDSYREQYKIPTWNENLAIVVGYGVTDFPGGSVRIIDEEIGGN